MKTQDYAAKPYEVVAGEVRAWLARRQISGRAAAAELGMTEIYLNRRLRGAVPFNVIDLGAIADLLGVPVTVFFEEPEPAMRYLDTNQKDVSDAVRIGTRSGNLRFPAERVFGRAA
jgi:transcriptional regulator with XRE-family HTH domain